MEQAIKDAVVRQYWRNANTCHMAEEALRVTDKTGRSIGDYQKIIEQYLVEPNFDKMAAHLATRLNTVEFTVNSHQFTVNSDNGEFFWTTEDGYEQKGVSASAAECQQAALDWASRRYREGVKAEEEAEQVRRFGKDEEQWNSGYYASR